MVRSDSWCGAINQALSLSCERGCLKWMYVQIFLVIQDSVIKKVVKHKYIILCWLTLHALLTWIIKVAAFSPLIGYGASVIYTHGIPHRLWGKYCLKVLTFLQWGITALCSRDNPTTFRDPFPGAQWGSEPKGYLVVTDFWPTRSGSATASLSLNNTTMPGSDKKEDCSRYAIHIEAKERPV